MHSYAETKSKIVMHSYAETKICGSKTPEITDASSLFEASNHTTDANPSHRVKDRG